MENTYELLNSFRMNLIKEIRIEYPRPKATQKINEINNELMPILKRLIKSEENESN